MNHQETAYIHSNGQGEMYRLAKDGIVRSRNALLQEIRFSLCSTTNHKEKTALMHLSGYVKHGLVRVGKVFKAEWSC